MPDYLLEAPPSEKYNTDEFRAYFASACRRAFLPFAADYVYADDDMRRFLAITTSRVS